MLGETGKGDPGRLPKSPPASKDRIMTPSHTPDGIESEDNDG